MLKKKEKIEKDLIDLVMKRKTIAQVQPSLNALQNILTPPLEPGIGVVGGQLAAAPGHRVQYAAGVVGPSTEYAGYNGRGQFFSAPTNASTFSGIAFNDGTNIVIIPESEAKEKVRMKCKKKTASLSSLKRSQLGGTINKVALCVSKLIVYGPYKKNNGTIAEGVDLGESLFGFIEDVLNEYNSLSTPKEKLEYKKSWDLMAHGYDDNPGKWHQAKFCDISEDIKKSFDPDVNAALLCRLVKDAIFCFDHNKSEVNDGHTHYFNAVLDKVEALVS